MRDSKQINLHSADPTQLQRSLVGSSESIGVMLLGAFAAATALLGATYLVLAIVVPLLPNDTDYLGISASQLCAVEDCRLVDFLSHGRMSYGGVLVAIGVMMTWLTMGPLRREEPWAWWTLLLAGITTYGSFLTFLAYGYFEPWHGAFVCIVSALGIAGLILTRPRPEKQNSLIGAFRNPTARAWLWSPDGRGGLMIVLLALGVAISGVSILFIASSVVFVPQDNAFIGLSSQAVSGINERLIPVMAHDRAGFGSGMLAIGILFAATAWQGFRSNARGAWYALGISGLIFYIPTLAIHISIGYTSVIHLLPIYSGILFLTVALATLRAPLR